MAQAFRQLGYRVGDQRTAELMIYDYEAGNFAPIIEYCKTADAFQDVPFSLPGTYIHLDKAFPHSKFILTIRDSAEQWHNSLVNFIRRVKFYIRPGYLEDAFRIAYNTTLDDKEGLMAHYRRHNQAAQDYFGDRLLVINLAHPDSYRRMCDYLGMVADGAFPHLNKAPN